MVARSVDELESFYFLGGRPALDLINTLRAGEEYLAAPDDLPAWAGQAGLLVADALLDPTETAALLPKVRALRAALAALAETVVAGAPTPPAALDTINAWLDQPRERPHLLAGAEGAVLTTRPATALPPTRLTLVGAEGPVVTAPATVSPLRAAFIAVAEDAARLLGTADRARIRVCANPTCRAYFYDRSQAGRRRWCDMARCGNVAKVQRYRRRRQLRTED